MSIFAPEYQCVPLRPFLYPDHGFHTSLLLLHLLPFSTFEPRESASSKLLSARNSISLSILSSTNSKPYASMNKDSKVVLFLPAAAAICLLNFNSPWELSPPRGLQVLAGIMSARRFLDTHHHVSLSTSFILLDNREPHLALFSPRFFFRSLLLDACSQVHSKRFHAVSQSHSFSSELTQLVLQRTTRRNHVALSFLAIFSDGQLEVVLVHLFFQLCFCHFRHVFFPCTKAVMSSTKTLSFNGGQIFSTSLSASCDTLRKSKQLQLDPGRMAVIAQTTGRLTRSPTLCSELLHFARRWRPTRHESSQGFPPTNQRRAHSASHS